MTLIKGGLVLSGATFRRMDLLIQGDRIAAAGTGLPAGDGPVIDARGMFVAPGFVDTHHHLWETTLRGVTAEWSIVDFLWGVLLHHRAAHTPDDVFAGSYAGAVAALDAGITTTIDHDHAAVTPEHAAEALRAVGESGIRAVWAYGLGDPATRDHLLTLRPPNPLVEIGVAANDTGSVPWEQTVAEFRFAAENGLLLTQHSRSLADMPPDLTWLGDARLLGPRQLFSHANQASDDELRSLAEAGAALASTPETESQMGMGHPAWNRARRLGVTVGLGTDIQTNNPADPFRTMRLALRLTEAHEQDGTIAGAMAGRPAGLADVLHAATLGGAAALGLADRIGSLEVGKQADVLLVRHDGLHQAPLTDPLAGYVLNARAADVDTVLVAGEVRKRDGRLVGDAGRRAIDLVTAAWQRLEPAIAARGGLLPTMPDGFLAQFAQSMAANAPAAPRS
ncbi:amidohydrolase family protein [Actinoplanes sp. NBRC 101535]|uniref:amidohydrolase family protein n=1 Tax=Actinoplanes sp. NBRC 101535 TaxID=3032196 RepID=UPI0024A4A15B|nr:amidohydrolase family protein [Actinoplanes sp. NBRC 101535]GLY02871.1 TRZ/ATZ family hydrolase [Actinoplanes sp. NBRC 101535]